MNVILSPMEARVLGCLIEKAVTTPEYYPLTLSALTAACNQKSNRDPIMQADEKEVVRALDSLREKKLASSVALANSRVPKYRHNILDILALTPQQLALLCELVLRGPQTTGELRTHAARMVPFTDTAEVQSILSELAAWEGGALASKFPRLIGQREERYAHRLCGELPDEAKMPQPPLEPVRLAVMAENERIVTLETRLTALGDELERLKTQFRDFVKQFK
ncbi:MAG: YceH family protein [Kiritimatiellae bacterium]|nr:YceH family protein [Kiritimatiellia bacterium]